MATDYLAEAHFAGQRLLVTGASGFLGSQLRSRLVEAGAEVYAVSRELRVSDDENLHWCKADVEDLDTARKLLAAVKPRTLFHLGGLVNGAPELEFVIPTFHSLVTSTVNLLTAAAETGCRRVVLVGSLEEPVEPTTEMCPTSPYGAAKWAAGAYGRMFQKLFGLPVVIARTYMTYGPGQPTRKVIPHTILSLLRGEPPVLSSGHRELDWVYVDDVVAGLLLAARTPGLDGATIDLGSGTLTSIRDVVVKLVDLLASRVGPVFNSLRDGRRGGERAADLARTWARIGWEPTTSLDQGLARTVDWYRRHQMAAERTQI